MVQTETQFAQLVEAPRRAIDEALVRCCDLGPDCPAQLAEAIHYSLLAPGKRLRPLLVVLAAEACGGSLQAALPAACAVEMIHAYSLVHDDLPAMDDDDLRRGRPTCHKVYGEALGILVGDALQALAFETISRDIRQPVIAVRMCQTLASAAGAAALVGGQVADLTVDADRADVSALKAIHRRKTGALLRASLVLGGLAAEATDEQLEALDTYGLHLGLAFQITDDLLDVRGDEAQLGKRVGKDTDRGKLTFPGLLGIDESERQAAELVREARAALAPLGPGAAPLEALAQYVVERDR